VPASSLDASLCTRFDVRTKDEPRLKPDVKYQGIPKNGYAVWMSNMLKDIPTILGVDYLQERESFKPKEKLIFTGPIDEYFGFEFGRLQYRGQKRNHRYYPDANNIQPTGQVNSPQHLDGPCIRQLEWSHMMDKEEIGKVRGTVCTTETPFSPDDPNDFEYPFPNQKNSKKYSEYREKANQMPNLVICGRLGEYKYLDMDQAIGRAMVIAGVLLKAGS
jgi:UDP-galactopyranose mutase